MKIETTRISKETFETIKAVDLVITTTIPSDQVNSVATKKLLELGCYDGAEAWKGYTQTKDFANILRLKGVIR